MLSYDNATVPPVGNGTPLGAGVGSGALLRCCKDFSHGKYGDESQCTFKHDCVKGHCAPEEPCVGIDTNGPGCEILPHGLGFYCCYKPNIGANYPLEVWNHCH